MITNAADSAVSVPRAWKKSLSDEHQLMRHKGLCTYTSENSYPQHHVYAVCQR